MYKVVVTGSRAWENPAPIEKGIKWVIRNRCGGDASKLLVIHGAAPGVDTMCDKVCGPLGVHTAAIKALWPTYNHGAGPKRNAVMLALEPDLCLAFHWDLKNGSKGTKGCVLLAKKLGIEVKLVAPEHHEAMPSIEGWAKIQAEKRERRKAAKRKPKQGAPKS